MDTLQAFQAAAHKGGFVESEGSEDGTVLWLRRQAQDGLTKTHQRICLDSITNSATVYWMSSLGKVDSKTFRTAAGLQEWFASVPLP